MKKRQRRLLAAVLFHFSFFILHSTFPFWPGDWRSGSAAPLHGDGRGFESLIAHHLPKSRRGVASFSVRAIRRCFRRRRKARAPLAANPSRARARRGKPVFVLE